MDIHLVPVENQIVFSGGLFLLDFERRKKILC